MATLEHQQSGRPVVCDARTLIGRAPGASLLLVDGGVSGEHASLFWDGERWLLRDLGSRNGTFCEEQRLEPGQEVVLCVGDCLRFGGPEQRWLILDLEPPLSISAEAAPLATTCAMVPALRVAHFAMRLRVSTDQEFIEVRLVQDGDERLLPPRAYFDLFLVLAQARLDDADASANEAGWLYFDDLCKRLGRSRQRVNVEVFRARQQLAELGVEDAIHLFERRATTRQIRLGMADVQIDGL